MGEPLSTQPGGQWGGQPAVSEGSISSACHVGAPSPHPHDLAFRRFSLPVVSMQLDHRAACVFFEETVPSRLISQLPLRVHSPFLALQQLKITEQFERNQTQKIILKLKIALNQC